MKLLVVRFDDTADLSPFAVGTEVSVTNPTDSLVGTIQSSMEVLETSFEGDYHLTPLL